MLRHINRPVSLSVVGTDLPIWSQVATAASIYQKDGQLFHLVLKEPSVPQSNSEDNLALPFPFRLIWLEISPSRAIMTMQESQKLSYRHFWAAGVYGISRYRLHEDPCQQPQEFKLRNYTRSLNLQGYPLPEHLSIDYELWTGQLQLGRYVLDLKIEH